MGDTTEPTIAVLLNGVGRELLKHYKWEINLPLLTAQAIPCNKVGETLISKGYFRAFMHLDIRMPDRIRMLSANICLPRNVTRSLLLTIHLFS